MRDTDHLDLILDEAPRRGVSFAVVASAVIHALILFYLVKSYRAPAKDAPAPPIARYVELIRQNPRDFVEAPGPKVKTAPLTAPFSDANRSASMPHPTGDRPTLRPGENSSLYVPRTASGTPAPRPSAPSQPQQPAVQQQAQSAKQAMVDDENGRTFIYRPTQARTASGAIDWRGAIKEVGKVASLGGGQQGLDIGNGGGEKGFAKDGPISFETQWYDWGEYAQSMVSRIRVNWYNNMPQIIQTGLKGVVIIRFTIHRDGQITDVMILSSSGVPPYDFAAKKAIELSSPLNPLPKDFPNETERVTAGFFYNQEPPSR